MRNNDIRDFKRIGCAWVGIMRVSSKRYKFIAEFSRRGWEGAVVETIPLINIHLSSNSKVITNHLWFNKTLGIEALGELKAGDIIEFEGRVDSYEKGYKDRYAEEQGEGWAETDYKISRPTKIRRVKTEVSVADSKVL